MIKTKRRAGTEKHVALPYILFLAFFLWISEGRSLRAFEERGWNVKKSTHFIVYYKNAEDKFVRNTIDKAEDYYKSIAEDLGFTRYDFWLWDKRAKIYIYDDAEDYQKYTGKPSWSGGITYYSEKVIETYPWARGFFDSLLPHELGHIIFREFVSSQANIPAWFDEGVAMYHEKAKRQDVKKKLLRAMEEGRIIQLGELSVINVMFISDPRIVELYYLEALSVVDYLINQFSRGDFVELCHALKERKTFDQAINDAYRVFDGLDDLNKAWLRYIKE